MFGRLLGLVFGVAVAAFGFGLWKPVYFKAYVNLKHVALGPFDAYRTIVAGLIMALGAVIALAAVQRSTAKPKAKPLVLMDTDTAGDPPAVSHDAPAHDHPAAAHDEHAPAHDEHPAAHDEHASAHDEHPEPADDHHGGHAKAHDEHAHSHA